MRIRARVVRAALGLFLLSVAGESLGAQETNAYRGRMLAAVLEELQEAGLQLIYSSAVVGEGLIVSTEPATNEPRAILDEVLDPLGLAAIDGPGESILIVARDRGEPGGSESHAERPTYSTEVVVIPGRRSVLREEQIATRTIPHDHTISVPAGGGDVSRIVEQLPGVAATDNSAAFSVRGSLPQDTSYVLDGLELYDPFHLTGLQSPFSVIDDQLVDQVEFLSGGFTADYGDRHGAFVEISTVGSEDRPHGQVEVGTLSSRVSYSAPFSENRGTWLVSAREWYPGAFQDVLELREPLRPRLGDTYAKVSWSLSPRTLISAHGLLAYDRLTFEETAADEVDSVEARTDSRTFWVRALHAWSPEVSSETVVSMGRVDRSRSGVTYPDEDAVAVSDDRRADFYGLTHDLGWQASNAHLIKGGLYTRWHKGTYRYSHIDEGQPSAGREATLEPSGFSMGLYAAHRMRVSPRIATELGLRWDRQDYTSDKQVSPRFNLLWQATEHTDVRFAIGRFQQSQRIHELRIEDEQTSFLPAEVSEQAELTVEHRFGNALRFRLDAYYRELSDLRPRHENLFEPVDLFPETTTDRVLVAPEAARLRGLEFTLSGDGSRPFTWWLSYAMSSAEDVIDGAFVPRSWDQTHAGRFLFAYRWDDRWLLSLGGTAHTGWPTTPASPRMTLFADGSSEIDAIPGERNSSRLGNYARLDLKLRRSIRLSGSRLSLTLDVMNLTDRTNECCVADFFFEPRADGIIGTRTDYDRWLGFTPTFSVRWDF